MPELTKLRIAFLKIRPGLFCVFIFSFQNVLSFNMVLYLCKQEKEPVVNSWASGSNPERSFLLISLVTTSQKVDLVQILLLKTSGCSLRQEEGFLKSSNVHVLKNR
jgi:hypothetical protein